MDLWLKQSHICTCPGHVSCRNFSAAIMQVTAVEFSIIFSQTPPYGFSFQSSVLLLLSGFCRHPNHNNIMKDLVQIQMWARLVPFIHGVQLILDIRSELKSMGIA